MPAPMAASINMNDERDGAQRRAWWPAHETDDGPRAETQRHDHHATARHAVHELDDRVGGGIEWHDITVTERPVAATTGTRSGGADDRAPDDDEDGDGECRPRVLHERTMTHRAHRDARPVAASPSTVHGTRRPS